MAPASFRKLRRRHRPPGACVLVVVVLACLIGGGGRGWVSPGTTSHGPRAVLEHRAKRGNRVVRHNSENIFERMVRVGKANLNKMVSSMEDPEKVLEQSVNDMQGDLVKVRQAYAEVLATQRRLQSQKDETNRVAEEWYKRAELAVQKEDDELAKEALTRRQAALDKVSDVEAQLSTMDANVEKLFDSVKSLEAKIQQAKEEKEQLIARAKTAATTSKVNEMLSDVTSGSSSVGAFDRMKEKVEMLETRAEVSEELASGAAAGSPSMEEKFRQLESGNKVDDALAALKGKKALPAGEDALDDELEAMRKKLGK